MSDSSPLIGPSETPRNMVEHAADDAMEAARARLEIEGGALQKMLVVLLAEGTSEPQDAVVAGSGFEDAGDVFAILLSQAVSVGRQLGLKVMVGSLNQG